jgi:hypothetical protein
MQNNQKTLLTKYHKILLILMILSSLIFGSIILLNAKANITFTPSGYTPSVGGPGGTETGLQDCPIGTIAIGMEGKDVTEVAAIREGFGYLSDYATRCGTITIEYSSNTVTTTYDSTTANVAGFILASRTPLPKQVDCPNGSVLGGYSGFQKFNASHNTILVNSLKPRCSTLTIDPVTKLLIVGPKTDTGLDYVVNVPAAGSEPIAKADCEGNSVVTGFEGRVGELFDLFKLACGQINITTLTVSIAGTDYADYKINVIDSSGALIQEGLHKVTTILEPGKYTLSLENTKTGAITNRFVCTDTKVLSTSPYYVELPNNTSNFCIVDPSDLLIPSLPPINPVLQEKAPTPAPAPVKLTTVTPTVLATKTGTTRTGGIYISIISILILSIAGILLFLKLKRKN